MSGIDDMGDKPDILGLFYDANYDPGQGILTFISMYGNTTITFDELQLEVNSLITSGIMFGVRCGAACLTLLIMWMISKNKKTPIFIINQCSLILIIMHSGLYFKNILSNLNSLSYILTGFTQNITKNNIHVFGAANIIQVLLVATIELSLVFQIRVMFKGDSFRKAGYGLLSIASGLGIATVVMYFYSAITNMIAVYNQTYNSTAKLFNVANILLSTSINFMTVVLIVKLFLAVRSRRYLGLKQFDSFHILLIMSCQTLIVPSILFILSYALSTKLYTDHLVVIATLLVVLSLPLSSMWASAANNSPKPSSFTTDYSNKNPSDTPSFYSQSISSSMKSKFPSKFIPFNFKSKDNSSDTRSENTYIGNYDMEKNGSPNHSYSSKDQSEVYTIGVSSMHTDIKSQKNISGQHLYTPSTEIDEEARDFWAGRAVNNSVPNDYQPSELPASILEELNSLDENNEGFLETKRITFRKQ
ncbi:hypothetical protein Kpol_1011p19 [Vanderwaltozyma polyspora DSM 70294]|uniref:Pheromone alpha factor receptor n=1 Tax=Vanderwaltozyma polyspora (strain ATCC 22028 / DSM 70294 / BCRC 21397 / CBS 2163 / NBRC 10782 / NRRL Y-8283 / UCD 57-17) TaxID=436907 RepID=A7TQX4_VANPO|nr:uncharacterized protein Kpol_1011p19 [Vanderwaltozyma polyspora DSM 70294]EDO15347.1 hypothetical protein Kpol_1011p19 [Vanderwaltozyma polyspora DSM 70294]